MFTDGTVDVEIIYTDEDGNTETTTITIVTKGYSYYD